MSKYNLSIEEENRLYHKLECYKILCCILAMAFGVLIFLYVLLITDSRKADTKNISVVSEYIDLEEVSNDGFNYIYRDKNTDVLYLQVKYYGGEMIFSPILNADGTPKLYEGE